VIAPLLAAIAPFFLFFLEQLLPYPYIIEEVFKLLLVLVILKSKSSNHSQPLTLALIASFLFTLTETVFYFFNFFPAQKLSPLLTRFGTTLTLHTLTTLIILFAAKKHRLLIPLSLGATIIIHYYYNQFISFV